LKEIPLTGATHSSFPLGLFCGLGAQLLENAAKNLFPSIRLALCRRN
jgi:hypothetical protein